MTIRVAINGFGRIGRTVLWALYESKIRGDGQTGKPHDIEIAAINYSGTLESNLHLTRYDTTHGRFAARVEEDNGDMIVNGDRIRLFSTRNPSELPWQDLGVDVVMECTGAFTSKEKAQVHLTSGAKKVLISAPGKSDVDATIVYGVNHHVLRASHTVVSNASCTTNGLAPVIAPLLREIGVVSGLMTTIHAYTNDQVLTDVHHKDLRRARSASMNMVPTKTGAAAAVGLVLPELAGKLDGFAIRVPTLNVSLVDLSFIAQRDTSVEEVNTILQTAAQGALKGILDYTTEPLVSSDFNHTPVSATVDASMTRVSDRLVKVGAWYDNEWGFSNRMLDTAAAMMAAK